MHALVDRVGVFLRPTSHDYPFLLVVTLLSSALCYRAGHGTVVDFLGHLAVVWALGGAAVRWIDAVRGR